MFGKLKTLTSDLKGEAACCFCSEAIQGEQPQEIVLLLSKGATQNLFAHGNCLREKLHPEVPYLTPAEMGDEG